MERTRIPFDQEACQSQRTTTARRPGVSGRRLVLVLAVLLCGTVKAQFTANHVATETEFRDPNSSSTPLYGGSTGAGLPADVVAEIQSYMDTLGVTSLHELGTMRVSTASGPGAELEEGLYVVDPAERAPAQTGLAPLPSIPGWTRHETEFSGTFDRAGTLDLPVFEVSSPIGSPLAGARAPAVPTSPRGGIGSMSPQAQYLSFNQTVVRFEGADLIDRAVFLADTIIFDDALLTLTMNVPEFYLVARTVIVESPSEITWEYAGTAAPGHPSLGTASSNRASYPTDVVSSGSGQPANDGGNGANGGSGDAGLPGIAAPDVYVIVRNFFPCATCNGLPDFDVRGQNGGRGQAGQHGQSGGNGAKGSASISALAWCAQTVGHGGDGGDGGNGGSGGAGGHGGDGGQIEISYVEPAAGTLVGSALTSGGARGEVGRGGNGGAAGEGGEAGDPDGVWCFGHPDWAGEDGDAGRDGIDGHPGSEGTDGQLRSSLISYEEWEEAFTKPYLVTVSNPAPRVDEMITIETYNLTGTAKIYLRDELTAGPAVDTHIFEVAPNLFELDIAALDIASGLYTIWLEREHDGEESNEYIIEIHPVIEGIRFDDLPVPGARAEVFGLGLRDDYDVVLDGVDLGAGVPILGSSGVESISFTIPVPSVGGGRGLFSATDGETAQSVRLRPPYPLGDTDEVEFTLFRTEGLTYRPTANSFGFTNGSISTYIKDEVITSTGWNQFRDVYGPSEVDAKLALSRTMTLTSFALWRLWWSGGNPSAVCMALSAHSVNDFFNGVEGVPALKRRDVAENIMLTQSGLLSKELLGEIFGETLSDVFGNPTGRTVDQVVEFFQNAGDGDVDAAPLLVMVPDPATYGPTFTCLMSTFVNTGLGLDAVLAAIGGCGLTDLALSIVDAVTADDTFNTLTDVVRGIADSHVLAPYMVVYEHPGDDLPFRIYFYDSNIEADETSVNPDAIFMEISQDGNAVEFHFDMLDPFMVGDYVYGSDEGWTLAGLTIEQVFQDVTLVLP